MNHLVGWWSNAMVISSLCKLIMHPVSEFHTELVHLHMHTKLKGKSWAREVHLVLGLGNQGDSWSKETVGPVTSYVYYRKHLTVAFLLIDLVCIFFSDVGQYCAVCGQGQGQRSRCPSDGTFTLQVALLDRYNEAFLVGKGNKILVYLQL